MAAGINDKFKKVSADNSYSVATTVRTTRTVGGGTTLEAFDLSKWADATAVNFLTYRKTTDPVTNVATVTNRTGWTALVNTGSNTLTNLTISPGYTDLGQQVGDYIEPVPTSKWANDLVDGLLVSHNQDGTIKNGVVTNATLSSAVGELGGTWGYYGATPTNVTLGNGVIDARYTSIGKTVHLRIRLVFGSTTSITAGQAMQFLLPRPSANNIEALLQARALDAGTNYRIGVAVVTGPKIVEINFDGGGGGWSNTTPFTWAVGDTLWISGTYEAA